MPRCEILREYHSTRWELARATRISRSGTQSVNCAYLAPFAGIANLYRLIMTR